MVAKGYAVGKGKKSKTNRGKRAARATGRMAAPNKKSSSFEKALSFTVAPSVARVPRTIVSSAPALSKCALKLALAIADPFAVGARGACLPAYAGSTQKLHSFTRFDVTFNTGGFAWVYVTPSVANDAPCIFASGAGSIDRTPWDTYGSTGITGTLNTGWEALTHNGPYATVDVCRFNAQTKPVRGRIVATGLRAQYTGTAFNEAGMYYCFHDTTHKSIAGAIPGDIGAQGDANVERISRDPCMLVTHPVHAAEYEFPLADGQTNSTDALACRMLYPYVADGVNHWSEQYNESGTLAYFKMTTQGSIVPVGHPVGMILMAGGIPGQTVHMEYIQHMEFIGSAAAAALTPNANDFVGTQNVLAAAVLVPAEKQARPNQSRWAILRTLLGEVLRMAKPLAVPLLESAVSALVL